MLMPIKSSASYTGNFAVISSKPSRLCRIILPGIRRISVIAIPKIPAQAPMIKVSALNTWDTFFFEAPIARRIPISFLRSSTLI